MSKIMYMDEEYVGSPTGVVASDIYATNSGGGNSNVQAELNSLNSNITPTSFISVSSSSATIASGGYVKIGKLVIVNVNFTTSAISASIGGFPKPLVRSAIMLYDWNADVANPAYINADSTYLSIPALLGTGKEYIAMGAYITSD